MRREKSCHEAGRRTPLWFIALFGCVMEVSVTQVVKMRLREVEVDWTGDLTAMGGLSRGQCDVEHRRLETSEKPDSSHSSQPLDIDSQEPPRQESV